MWFAIWATLIVGSLVVAFFLGRDLYRKAKALVHEVVSLTEVMDRLEERSAELKRMRKPFQAPVNPLTLTDAEVQDIRTKRVERKLARQLRKAERHAATYARWESFSH